MKLTHSSIAIFAVGAVVLTGCSGQSAATTDQAVTTLTIGAIQDVPSWDPAMAHVGHTLVPYQAPYDTLILREPDGTLSPMLSTEWEWDDSRTTLTLELETGVTFTDGTAFDAEAVIANFDHFKSANGRQALQLAAYDSATALDENTVEVQLSAPDPAFEIYLSQAAGLMASPAAIDSGTLESAPVGTGPYLFDEAGSVRDSQLSFTAREDYWNPDLQKFDNVTFRILGELSARVNAVLSGQVDYSTLDAKSAVQAEEAGLTLVDDWQVDWTGMTLADRDGSINPALADVRVRQALNYAIDRETLLEQIQLGYGSVTSQVFGPESGAFAEDLENYYTFDPDRARELLADAGYAEGFELSIPVIPTFSTHVTAVGQQLADVGITVTQVPESAADYVANMASSQFSVFPYNLGQTDAWVAMGQIVAPSAVFNPFRNSSPEVDDLLAAMQLSDDDSGRAAQDLNRYVTEEAWFLPFYRIDQIAAYQADRISVSSQIQQPIPSLYNFAPVG